MSLSIASRIASTALSAAQVQISVASSNVANAATEGYTTKTAEQNSVVYGGLGTGVAVSSISGGVDRLLLKSLVAADTELGAADTTATYTDRLQTLFGSTDGESSSIADDLTALETSLLSLASTPDDATLATATVGALDDVASGLRSLSSSVQSLRADADQEIADDVDTVNQALHTIADLNNAIVSADAQGVSTADLVDQRDTALQTIAGLMDVNWYTTSSSTLQIYTSSGQALLDGTVHELNYTTVAAMTPETVTSGITVSGKDITADIGSGSIGALLTLRDETLPAVQDELDTLATGLITAINAVSNTATATPAPTSLTGTATVDASDAFSATGSARVALVDEDGRLVSEVDLDLSAYPTVGELVDALDSISGVDASIDADGHLTLASTVSGAGIAIGALDGVTADGDTLSAAFGLADLVTGTGADDIRVASAVLADTSLLPIARLDEDATSAGDTALAAGSSAVAEALNAAMSDDHAFGATGNLGSHTGDFASYAAAIISDVASTASRAQTSQTTAETVQSSLASTVSSQSGVNLDEETAKISEYQTLYSAAAQVMQTINEMFSTLLKVAESAG